jgi:uncharacterized membrane protein
MLFPLLLELQLLQLLLLLLLLLCLTLSISTCLRISAVSCESTALYAPQKPLCSWIFLWPRGALNTLFTSSLYMQVKSATQSSSVALQDSVKVFETVTTGIMWVMQRRVYVQELCSLLVRQVCARGQRRSLRHDLCHQMVNS